MESAIQKIINLLNTSKNNDTIKVCQNFRIFNYISKMIEPILKDYIVRKKQ